MTPKERCWYKHHFDRELNQYFPVEELFWGEDFSASCAWHPPAAERMLWAAFLLFLLRLQKYYSTLIAQWWQSWASSLQIWLVMGGGEASLGHRDYSQPKSAQRLQTKLQLQILLEKGNIGFAVVFFSNRSLSCSLWHSRLLCNNLDLSALSPGPCLSARVRRHSH